MRSNWILDRFANLDYGDQSLIGGGVCGDREASGWIPGCNLIHRIPRRTVGLIFICHRQIGHNHIHTIFRHLSVELQEKCTKKFLVYLELISGTLDADNWPVVARKVKVEGH